MRTGGGWYAAMAGGVLGIALQLTQAALWAPAAYAGLALAAGVLALAAARLGRRHPAGALLLLTLAAVSLGLAWAGARATWRLADALDPALAGRDLELVGVVAEMPQWRADGVGLKLAVEQARLDGRVVAGVPSQVALSWSAGLQDGELRAGPQRAVRAGQRWRFPVRLQPPLGAMNPQGFDVELWWFERGVRATGVVRSREAAPARWLEDTGRHPVERARGAVREALFDRVDDPRAAGVLAGLALGDQSAIEAGDWDLFRRTGVAHLLAVSGLHITMFAWVAQAVVAALWRRSARAVRRVDAGSAGRWGGLALAAGYAFFAGWGVPAQRTVLMLAVVTVLRSRALHWPWSLRWLASAAVVLALDPWALLQAGFWLSFAAVGLLMLDRPVPAATAAPGASAWARRARRLLGLAREGARTQLRASLGLAPLSLLFFHQVSVAGVLANLLAIPWVSFVVTPLALLGIGVPGLWTLGAVAVSGLHAVLEPLSSWPGAVWSAAAAPVWAQVGGLLAAVLALAPLPLRLRALAWPLVLPLLFPPQDRPPPGRFELLVTDIGQGTAVVVRTAGHTLVFDTGPQYGRDSDAGRRLLLPLLGALGESHLDLLMLSHSDLDHVGGAAAVLRGLPVREVSSSLPEDHPLQAELARAGRRTVCEAGQRWRWDGVEFELLHPGPRDLLRAARGYLGPNGVSCVLKVSADGGRALLTGDIEAVQEWGLVRTQAAALRSEVLVVPHHGSKTSSTEDFLRAVRPSLALIQTGWHNRYGHPHPEVLARYHALGIPVLTSPACGAWRWRSGLSLSEAVCTRPASLRYWHTRLDPDSPGGLELAKSSGTSPRTPGAPPREPLLPADPEAP